MLKTGGLVSSVVMTVCAVAVLPQASVAVQMNVVVLVQASTTLSTTCVETVAVPQLSAAVGGVGVAKASPHSTVTLAGTLTKVGATLSEIVIVRVAVATLPQPSVAVHVRVMVLRFTQVESLVFSLKVTIAVAELQLSVADTEGVVGTSPRQVTVAFAGKLAKVGAILSRIVIVWLAVAALPQASVAVQVRVMVLRFAQVESLVVSRSVTVGVSPQLSVAVTFAAVGKSAVQLIVKFAGMPTKVGAISSSTTMI